MTRERMRMLVLVGVGLVVLGVLLSVTVNFRGGLLVAGGVAVLAGVGVTWLQQRRGGD
ncbi:hypothetical protein [Amnibacterium endophyticum]|uniref:Uncharacterized protein n=1 Tax=Amnibacterium endophyticum TaxID=2109337 RepID=A0ABW4LGC9_9MICO